MPRERIPPREQSHTHTSFKHCVFETPRCDNVRCPVPVVYKRFLLPSPHEVARSTWGPVGIAAQDEVIVIQDTQDYRASATCRVHQEQLDVDLDRVAQ